MRQVILIVSLCLACSNDEVTALPRATLEPPQTTTFRANYGLSDGFGYVCSLALEKDGSFSFVWTSDVGPMAKALGKYSADSKSVRFVPSSNNFRQDPLTFTPMMHRVRWGQREYLIGEERLLDFANAINSGREPRNHDMGIFYLKDGDEAKQVRGFPELPAQWNEYLLDKPVTGIVVAVKQRETPTQRPIVVIDRGGKSGLRNGMKLFATNPDRSNFKAYLTLTEVQPDSATATVPFQYNHIKPGDRVSSREGVKAAV